MPERRYIIKILISPEAQLTYRCNKTYISGYATDCEDNEAKTLDVLLYDSYIVEIIDRERVL